MEKTMKEKLAEAKKIYFMDDFKKFMRKMQGLTDDDFKKPVPRIIEKILKANEADPLKMFERIMREVDSEWEGTSPLPTNSDWHHFIVPGVIMTALRNSGYEIDDRDIEEAISRGQKFAGGSCGFMGTCGGAYGLGIVASMIKKTNPLHDEQRSEILRLVAETLMDISKYPRRCCKRSSYMAIEKATGYLRNNGFDKLTIGEIQCHWAPRNKMCLGIRCLYFPKKGEH
jgi:hypothetical protein